MDKSAFPKQGDTLMDVRILNHWSEFKNQQFEILNKAQNTIIWLMLKVQNGNPVKQEKLTK